MNDTQTPSSNYCLIIEILIIHHPKYTDLWLIVQLVGQPEMNLRVQSLYISHFKKVIFSWEPVLCSINYVCVLS